MAYDISETGLAFIKKWEEFVGYVYDDKIPKHHIDGVLKYPEWQGGPVKGTLSVGYGHTDAAGAPLIHQGMTCTEPQAVTMLHNDLRPVQAAVNAALKVGVTQHQYDALVSLDYNCPSATPKVAALVNADQRDDVPKKMLQFVNSKGERMPGLVNRRNGEIVLWNAPDNPDQAAKEVIFSPKAEREPPPIDARSSKTIAGGSTIAAGGVLASIQAMNDAAEPIKAAKGTLQDLGVMDWITLASHSQYFWVGLATLAIAVFIIWDRNKKRLEDHV